MEIYHFKESAVLEAPVERVWDAVTEPGWLRWSPSFRRMTVHGGQPLAMGSVVDTSVKGGLPFTLDFSFEVTRLDRPQLVEIRAWGDLEGTGRWEMERHPRGTAFVYFWDVGMTNRFLDLFGRLSLTKRIMARNHNRVMEATFRAMATELEATAPIPPEHRAADLSLESAPPPPDA